MSEMFAAQAAKIRPTGNIPIISTTDHNKGPNPDAFKFSKDAGVVWVPGAELLFVDDWGRDIHDYRQDKAGHENAVASAIAIWWMMASSPENREFSSLVDTLQARNESKPEQVDKVFLQDLIISLHHMNDTDFWSAYPWIDRREYGRLIGDMRIGIERAYHKYRITEKAYPKERHRSEVLCYWPPGILDKANRVIEEIYRSPWPNGAPNLRELMTLLQDKMGADFDKLVFVLAHPESIDTTWWGRLINKVMSDKDIKLYWDSIEVLNEDLARFFSGIEGINGGHPPQIAESIYRRSHRSNTEDRRYKLGPAFTANSDAHSLVFLDAAYQIVPMADASAEAALAALSKGEVLAMWGLTSIHWPLVGEYTPFGFWGASLKVPNSENRNETRVGHRLATKGLIYARGFLDPFIRDRIVVVDREIAQRNLLYAKLNPMFRM